MDGIIRMLPAPLQRWSTHIDFAGQQKAERIFQIIIVIASVVGFVVGYVMQQLWITFAILGAGFVLANLIVLPCWPSLRKDPIYWQPDVKERTSSPAPKKEVKKNK